MSWPPDRPNLSTITVGRIWRYPRLAPSRVSASAANGRATASARSESATMPGAAPDLPRWPLSRRCASGPANSSMAAVQASDTTTTGTTAARRMAGTRSSWPRRRSRAMKLTSPTHAPSPATVSTIRKSEIAVKKAPATGLLYSRVITTVSTSVVIAADQGPDQVQGTAPGHVLQPRPGLAGIPACHGRRRGVRPGSQRDGHQECAAPAGVRPCGAAQGPSC